MLQNKQNENKENININKKLNNNEKQEIKNQKKIKKKLIRLKKRIQEIMKLQKTIVGKKIQRKKNLKIIFLMNFLFLFVIKKTQLSMFLLVNMFQVVQMVLNYMIIIHLI